MSGLTLGPKARPHMPPSAWSIADERETIQSPAGVHPRKRSGRRCVPGTSRRARGDSSQLLRLVARDASSRKNLRENPKRLAVIRVLTAHLPKRSQSLLLMFTRYALPGPEHAGA